jgi:HEPN domain-containing protein
VKSSARLPVSEEGVVLAKSKSVDPNAVFDHGDRFLFAETELRKLVERDGSKGRMLQFPGMVICAFAAELYFKCLLLLEGKKPPQTHHLQQLFDRLNDDDKALIKAEWARMVAVTKEQIEAFERQMNVHLPRELATALADCGDAFTLLRYVYETRQATFYITHLPLVLRKVIQSKTQWA